VAGLHKSRIKFLKGWNYALEAFRGVLEELPPDSVTPDQERFRNVLFDLLAQWSPDEGLLKPQPTNAQLAAKYAVSVRTITNWRREGCPFNDGQWRVLDWMKERRYVPAGAKTKFARQFKRREPDELLQLCSTAKILNQMVRTANKLGVLNSSRV